MTKISYENCISYIVSEKQKGVGSRAIAKALGSCSKSTVNYYYNKWLDETTAKPESTNLNISGPKILLFDIEFAPAKVMCYGRYKQFIVQDFVLEEGYLLSFSAKWLGSDNVVSFNLPYYDCYKGAWDSNDYELAKDLHKLLDEADFTVAHNLKQFDFKVANTRFAAHGLPPISPTKLVDTLEIAKKNFRFPDNKLNTIANYFGLGSKTEGHGADMWRKCLEDDAETWKHELEYNIQDVLLLEQVYLKLRPFDNKHPSLIPYYKDDFKRCTCCGSTNLWKTDKKAYTSLSEFEVYKCEDCGKHSRARINLRTKEQMNNTLMNVN